VGKMDIYVGKLDDKCRLLIPANLRKILKIHPHDTITYGIKNVEHQRSFTERWEGIIKGAGKDPAKLKHKAFIYGGK